MLKRRGTPWSWPPLAGIPEYWAVDPEKKEVMIHRLSGERWGRERIERGEIVSKAILGFRVKVGWFFEEPLPAARCLQSIL